MLGKTNKSLNSTSSSARGSQVGKKENFLQYFWRRMLSFMSVLWARSRRFMWITSTGTFPHYAGCILLVLPFTFAYISEFQKEAAKIMACKSILTQPKTECDKPTIQSATITLYSNYL